ncbi:MAG TPA: gluconokinase [Chitinophagaceae bacterium]
MQYILGVDIGTTRCKAVALQRDGRSLFETSDTYNTIQIEPGQSEQDPKEIFDSVLRILKEMLDRFVQPAAVSFSAAMHSLLAIDKHGEPITPAYTWADTRSNEWALQLRSLPGCQALYERTGTPIHPMSPLCKIMWIRERMPEVFERAAKFISIKEYVYYQFTGKYLVDHSIASATGLFNIHTKQWDDEALQLAGITAEQLSQPVPVTYSTTAGAHFISRLKKLDKDVPLIIGASDGCLANLGSGAIFPGEAALTIGTSGAVRVAVDRVQSVADQSLFNYILNEELYIAGGAVSNGAAAMLWFADNCMPGRFESVEDIIEFMNIANEVPPGAGGLVFLPYLSGERAPFWDASARGAFVGLQTAHRPAHMARAVAEGISFAVYQVLLEVEKNYGTIETLYASGGFVISRIWVQMIADITGKRIRVLTLSDASAMGACFLGMHAISWFTDWKAIKELIPLYKEYQPIESNHQFYQKQFEIYRQLYPKLKDNFRELEKLQQQ